MPTLIFRSCQEVVHVEAQNIASAQTADRAWLPPNAKYIPRAIGETGAASLIAVITLHELCDCKHKRNDWS
jgi:hypothetical protein